MKFNKRLSGALVIVVLLTTGCSTAHPKKIVNDENSMESANADLVQLYANRVAVYYLNKKPSEYYQILRMIAVDNYSPKGKKYSKYAIKRALREKAVAIGANGVIHVVSGVRQTTAEAVIIYQ